MTAVLAFSGGKDSMATGLWLRDQGIQFLPVFNDTGWEHPLTYAYIERINHTVFGGTLVRLKPDQWTPVGTTEKYGDMRDLVSRKGRVPSVRARFCTEYLKTNPMRAFLATVDTVVLYQGIRADESPARAKMLPGEWSDYYDCRVERPLFRWTSSQVFALLARHGVEPNPLYKLGSKRVGCFPCVLTRHAELKRLSASLPEVWDRIAELERLSGRSYFPPGFIPARFCSNHAEQEVEIEPESDGPQLRMLEASEHRTTVKRMASWPSIEDVRRYLADHTVSDLERFGETPACTSVYNLCE